MLRFVLGSGAQELLFASSPVAYLIISSWSASHLLSTHKRCRTTAAAAWFWSPPSITPKFHEGDVVQLTRGLPSYVGPVSSGVWRPERGDFQQRRMGLCGTAWWDPTLAAGTGMWLPCSYLVQAVKEDVLGMPGARISALVRGSWWHAGRASEWITLYTFERRTLFALVAERSRS